MPEEKLCDEVKVVGVMYVGDGVSVIGDCEAAVTTRSRLGGLYLWNVMSVKL